jgi:hypothetical protein
MSGVWDEANPATIFAMSSFLSLARNAESADVFVLAHAQCIAGAFSLATV